VTCSSAPDATKMESSVGCHSIDVIGARCHVKLATGSDVDVAALIFVPEISLHWI
jgi:hypothetical protein